MSELVCGSRHLGSMKRSVPAFATLLLLTFALLGIPAAAAPLQEATAAPAAIAPGPPSSPSASSAISPSTSTASVIRTTVRRVSVDVVVSDAKRHPVRGLTRADFQIYEDGKLQPVRSFDPHFPNPLPTPPPVPDLVLPPNTFSNLVQGPQTGPVTVILYDVLNTPPDALHYAHAAMVNFIKKQAPGSRTAIFVLGDQLRMLRGFTDDETRLLNAVADKRTRAQQSTLLLTTNNPNITASDQQLPADYTVGEMPSGANMLQNLKSLETTENNFMLQQRLEETVDGFSEIARFLAALPGRKNLIWLSASFPSSVLPDADPTFGGTANEFGDTIQFGDRVKQATQLLNESHVAVYPIDVRGLEVNPAFNAANNVRFSTRSAFKISSFSADQAAEHGTMELIANDTGGRAFYNTNGLDQALHAAMEEGSNYYTLTYTPTNPIFDGTQRRIRIELRPQGYQVSYRKSYFAGDGKNGTEPSDATDVVIARNAFLDAGMQHGAPISSEIFIEANVIPIGPAMAATAKEMEALAQFVAVRTRSKKKLVVAEPIPTPTQVQHYEVSYAILGRQLELPSAGNGKYMTDMLFALAAFTPDNLIVNGMEIQIKNQIPESQLQKIKKSGYHASMVFVVPVEAGSLRLAARDSVGQRTGSIEIPLPIAPPPNPHAPAPAPKH